MLKNNNLNHCLTLALLGVRFISDVTFQGEVVLVVFVAPVLPCDSRRYILMPFIDSSVFSFSTF
jgi:hypothetical protein